MAWFADVAGKAESLLNKLDEQAGVALRNKNVLRSKIYDHPDSRSEQLSPQKKKTPPLRTGLRKTSEPRSKSPVSTYQHQSRPTTKQIQPKESLRQRKSPTRRSRSPYDLNNCPKTLVEDYKYDEKIFGDHKKLFPGDMEIADDDTLTYRLQNLEVENAMLKNELNVMNKEITELLARLRKTEEELSENVDKIARTRDLEEELNVLKESHKEITEKIKSTEEKLNSKETETLKMETELRHAQTTAKTLQSELDKTAAECRRLESDWKAYRARVKNTLQSKDKEIRSMQEGMNLTEDTKILIEQLECLKEEREDLTEAIVRFRNDCEEMRTCMEKLEARATNAERTAAALRDAMREERTNRHTYEAEYAAASKEMKQLKQEYNQIIETLENTIRDKEAEIKMLLETPIQSSKTSALTLNVAEYSHDNVDAKRIEYLTDVVVQKQGMIERLTADYNDLKIKLRWVEDELKSVYSGSRNGTKEKFLDSFKDFKRKDITCNKLHSSNSNWDGNKNSAGSLSQKSSIVDLTDTNVAQNYTPKPARRFKFYLRKYPIMSIILLYMIGLHFWAGLVIFSSAPAPVPERTSSHT